MAHSLEARSPFLDHRLMEFMAGCPAATAAPRPSKHLLKSALRGILPTSSSTAQDGFGVPLGQWLRTGLRELLEDTVLDAGPSRVATFRPEALRTMMRVPRGRQRRVPVRALDLLMLEMWHRTYIDQVPRPPAPEPASSPPADRMAGDTGRWARYRTGHWSPGS